MHYSGGHFEIAQYGRQRKKIACLSADSEISRSSELVTKISNFCNEVNDYLIMHPYYYDVPRTEDVGLPTKSRLNVGPASQPSAGSMPVNRLRRWPNNNPSMGLLYTLRKHVEFIQCCFNIDPQASTLARH